MVQTAVAVVTGLDVQMCGDVAMLRVTDVRLVTDAVLVVVVVGTEPEFVPIPTSCGSSSPVPGHCPASQGRNSHPSPWQGAEIHRRY